MGMGAGLECAYGRRPDTEDQNSGSTPHGSVVLAGPCLKTGLSHHHSPRQPAKSHRRGGSFGTVIGKSPLLPKALLDDQY
jgi:hypothetical protein